ncbi:hypothetical protein [Phreatobacter stygius]|uniref:Uncharacterized protein n=1 Tax=Phreatobacter stygius TaxID=1940610 RepID=A0A4D7B2U5_9HYPH|nr:hypothetical protein [Phreatobacter stygius]QCI64400.1 hypothetical protein E8M01_09245 [Phreatobacter stygius]
MTIAQHAASNRADAVSEFVTDARIEALNSALSDRGIAADRIISILPMTGQTLINAAPAQFRVLYRLN